MMNLQSPQYSNNSKADLFSKQRSPSMRNKRIPSAQDNYMCYSNQNLKVHKSESPSKVYEEIRRRKSHHMENSTNSNNSNTKKKIKINTNDQDIMTSIQTLKQEYKTLKQAYKQLILQKMGNIQQINKSKHQNIKLKTQLDQQKIKNLEKEEQINRLRKQIQKLQCFLSMQEKKRKSIENDLYFMNQQNNIHLDQLGGTQKQDLFRHNQFINTERIQMSQQKEQFNDLQEICSKTISNDSHMMSFSLTSIIQETMIQDKHMNKRQHLKALSHLSHPNGQFDKIDLKLKKQDSNFKKNKKQIGKMDSNFENRQLKAVSNINPLNQLLYMKSPVNSEKKMLKNPNSSNSKKKRIEEKQNLDVKNNKKKTKKVLQINPIE